MSSRVAACPPGIVPADVFVRGIEPVLAQTLEPQYICPGETRPISRAVHLSRLATFYAGCRECPFRHDVPGSSTSCSSATPGTAGLDSASDLDAPAGRAATPNRATDATPQPLPRRRSVVEVDGVRGVWRNELTRTRAADFAAAFASMLWESSPVTTPTGRRQGGSPAAPTVVVAHDERPSAPDLVTGVAAALRLMGCQVVDVGAATAPGVWHAVDHLDASGGILVTGSGRPPSWTGLDFIGRGGLPLSHLEELERRAAGPIGRPTRTALAQRSFQARVPYEAGLLKHFHALRPLRVCCATSPRIVRELLERLFSRLPCRLEPVDTPHRARDVANPEDDDVRRLGAAVVASNADLGVLIDDDARRCGFVDERGTLVPPETVLRMLARLALAEHPRSAVTVTRAVSESTRAILERHGGRVVETEPALQRFSEAMRENLAVCGGDTEGRLWFREGFPVCDALITLARVMDALSRSDRACSEAARDAERA